MKKKFRFTGYFEIDFAAERRRITTVFADDLDVQSRQLNLLALFEDGKFKEYESAYDALPYNNDNECDEREYVGLIFHDIIDMLFARKFKLEKSEII